MQITLRPDESNRERNIMILQSTFLQLRCSDPDEDEHLEGPPVSMQQRMDGSEYLLSIVNGDWRSDHITHHCQLGCCRSVKESKLKLWVSLQDGQCQKCFFLLDYDSVTY